MVQSQNQGFVRARIQQAVKLAIIGLPVIFSPSVISLANAAEAESKAAKAADTLPEVKVKAAKEAETALSSVRGYIAKRAISATKTDTPIIEVPQSISVITADQMEDQKAESLQAALRYSAGVVADQYGDDSRGDSFAIRGLDATTYLNGLRERNTYYTETTRPDPYMLERIEILRGPSSMLYGNGGVGGIVNLVSKLPQAEAKREIGVSLGNYNRKQINADLTGPVADSDTLFYRVVMLGRDSDSAVDYAKSQRTLFAPSLTWRPNDKTSVTVLAQYQLDDGKSTPQFFPFSSVLGGNPNGKVSYSTFLSDPHFDRYRTESNAVGWKVEHAFNDTWTVRQNFRYTSSRNEYRSLYVNSFFGAGNPFAASDPVNQRVLNRYLDGLSTDSQIMRLDNNAQAKFDLGNTQHTLLMGVDYSRFRQDKNGFFGGPGSPGYTGNPIDIYNPVYAPLDFTGVTSYGQQVARQYQTGVYIQDQIKIDKRWIATLGLRRDEAKNDLEGAPAEIDKKTTGRYGLSYLLDNGWAPYVSYAESFLPVQGTTFSGALFKPQEGKQWEMGLKYMPAGSRSRFTASIYDLRDENRLTPDLLHAGSSVQQGRIRTIGVELEAAHSFANRLDVIAAYSHTDAKYDKSNTLGEKGNQVEAIPRNLASAWAIKRFAIGDTDGFRAGLGVRYIGDSYDSTNELKAPDATLFDAMLGFDQGSWRYSLNASNLADKEYVSTCISRGDCWLGSRRVAIASATYSW
ncbi:MAG TPA: TonB-dependent siderophore receptor [Methylophilaceae bacterium]|nr:TonB-dependent siderophore receptor [Methylophilaceae bacterium]